MDGIQKLGQDSEIIALQAKIEEQRKHLVRLEERNMELSSILLNVLKDITFYQNYVMAECYRNDFKTAAQMRQALYECRDKLKEMENGKAS